MTPRDFSALPPLPKVDDTIATVDTSRVPDPDDVRNRDQHQALRDD